ncbi:MAG: DUF3347 domain-containing protein [Chitinophagaceae bacterium]|jgi:hypothetical protein|nr:MAG: DUF3347 domain-containing protein [Chitinophagaceae bacterium]
MKSRIIFSLAAAFALASSFNSFGNERNATATVSLERTIANNSDKAYQQYVLLDNALTKDDAITAQKAAVKLADALKDIPESADAMKAALAISKTKNIANQRESFASLSLSIIKLLKAHKPDNAMPYIHYCPMKKAYWLSNSEKIQNPYYGKSMPSCGKTIGMIM